MIDCFCIADTLNLRVLYFLTLYYQQGDYNATLPAVKRKHFKPIQEKQTKFDSMLDEFPKNLATPIDVSYLRKIVRMESSNKKRREKRKSGSGGGGEAVARIDDATSTMKQPQQDVVVCIPQKGLNFPTIKFNEQDYSG